MLKNNFWILSVKNILISIYIYDTCKIDITNYMYNKLILKDPWIFVLFWPTIRNKCLDTIGLFWHGNLYLYLTGWPIFVLFDSVTYICIIWLSDLYLYYLTEWPIFVSFDLVTYICIIWLGDLYLYHLTLWPIFVLFDSDLYLYYLTLTYICIIWLWPIFVLFDSVAYICTIWLYDLK